MKYFIRTGCTLLVATALATFPTTSEAVPIDLDRVHGTGSVGDIDPAASRWATGTAIQPDGKIIGVGDVIDAGPDGDALVFRLDADGNRDPQFGIRQLDGNGGHYEEATAAAVQPDGRIVVVGRTTDNDDGAVWRLLPGGSPDVTFGGGDGFVTVDSGADEMLADVAIAPDGAIVVAGRSTVHGQAAVYRLTSSGDLDAGFGTGGALSIGKAGSLATAVAVQPDGGVLVAGYLTPADGMVVRRLTPSGATDYTFGGGDGEATISAPAQALDLALQPDGRIVVAGQVNDADGSDALVARYSSAGLVDASFGSATGTTVDLGANERFESLSLVPGGGVVASGATDGGDDALVVELDAQGHPAVVHLVNGGPGIDGTQGVGGRLADVRTR